MRGSGGAPAHATGTRHDRRARRNDASPGRSVRVDCGAARAGTEAQGGAVGGAPTGQKDGAATPQAHTDEENRSKQTQQVQEKLRQRGLGKMFRGVSSSMWKEALFSVPASCHSAVLHQA